MHRTDASRCAPPATFFDRNARWAFAARLRGSFQSKARTKLNEVIGSVQDLPPRFISALAGIARFTPQPLPHAGGRPQRRAPFSPPRPAASPKPSPRVVGPRRAPTGTPPLPTGRVARPLRVAST